MPPTESAKQGGARVPRAPHTPFTRSSAHCHTRTTNPEERVVRFLFFQEEM